MICSRCNIKHVLKSFDLMRVVGREFLNDHNGSGWQTIATKNLFLAPQYFLKRRKLSKAAKTIQKKMQFGLLAPGLHFGAHSSEQCIAKGFNFANFL